MSRALVCGRDEQSWQSHAWLVHENRSVHCLLCLMEETCSDQELSVRQLIDTDRLHRSLFATNTV